MYPTVKYGMKIMLTCVLTNTFLARQVKLFIVSVVSCSLMYPMHKPTTLIKFSAIELAHKVHQHSLVQYVA